MSLKTILKNQFDRVQENGWLGFFETAASEYNFSVNILLAVGSRESNLRNIVGDNGHGYGIGQIDIRSYPDFINSGDWKSPEKSINKLGEVLNFKRTFLVNNQGKSITIRDSKGKKVSFIVPEMDEDTLLRVTIASYNTGAWAAYHFSKGRDIDYSTTGKDYSKDVLNRSEIFASFIPDPEKEEPVVEESSQATVPATIVSTTETEPPSKVEIQTEVPVANNQGFIETSVGSAKRLWAWLVGLGLTIGQGTINWAGDHKELVYLGVGLAVVYILIQTFLDNKRMKHAANLNENNVK